MPNRHAINLRLNLSLSYKSYWQYVMPAKSVTRLEYRTDLAGSVEIPTHVAYRRGHRHGGGGAMTGFERVEGPPKSVHPMFKNEHLFQGTKNFPPGFIPF